MNFGYNNMNIFSYNLENLEKVPQVHILFNLKNKEGAIQSHSLKQKMDLDLSY